MDVQRDFKHRPPREPLTSLAAFVRDFQWRFPRDRRDMVVEYCRKAPDFDAAVIRAVDSIGENGKMHNHQTRVKAHDRALFGQRIRAYMNEHEWRLTLGAPKSMRDPDWPAHPRAFDRLHDRLDELKPKGIGPVTVYDVATRLGAYFDVEPQSLYLHAGVKEGYRSLLVALNRPTEPGAPMFRTYRDIWTETNQAYIIRSEWPASLRALTADEAEDFCCTYRTEFLKYPGRLEEGT